MYALGYTRDPLVGVDSSGNQVDLIARDRSFKNDLLPSLTLGMGDVDLSQYTTDTNQEAVSACAGNATADSIEVLNDIEEKDLAAREGREPLPPVQLSRMFVYSMAREILDQDGNGWGDIDKDAGSYIRLCFETLSRFGICSEAVWPYDVSKVHTRPSLKALRQAAGHRIHSYYRIKEDGDDRLEAVVQALRGRHPVVFGTLLEKSFMDANGPTVVGKPTGPTMGGHAMLCVGYVNGKFLVRNSWGRSWRENGFFLMEPEYMAWEETSDLWVPTLGVHFAR